MIPFATSGIYWRVVSQQMGYIEFCQILNAIPCENCGISKLLSSYDYWVSDDSRINYCTLRCDFCDLATLVTIDHRNRDIIVGGEVPE
jgi:hypothetical protein